MKEFKDILIFKNETDLKRLYRSMAVYNKRAYKQLIFNDTFRDLDWVLVEGNTYRADLYTDKLFEKVYGKCYVVAEIKNDIYRVVTVEPKDLLMAGYKRILDTYRGIPYRDKKDLMKIKIMEKMLYGNKKENKRHIPRHN